MEPYPESCLTGHPAVLAIAVDLILHPQHRQHHSTLVLHLVDKATERIRQCLSPEPNSSTVK